MISGFALCQSGEQLTPELNAALLAWASSLHQAPQVPLLASPPDPGSLPVPPLGIFRGDDAKGTPLPASVFTGSETGWVGVVPGSSVGVLTDVWAGQNAAGLATLLQATYDSQTGAMTGGPVSTFSVPGLRASFAIVTAVANTLVLSTSDETYWLYAPGTPNQIVGPLAPGITVAQIVAQLAPLTDGPVGASSSSLSGIGGLVNSVTPLASLSVAAFAPSVPATEPTVDQSFASPAGASASPGRPSNGYYYYVDAGATKAGMTSAGCSFARLRHSAFVNLHFGSMHSAGVAAGGGETLAQDASMGNYRTFNQDLVLSSDFVVGYLNCRGASGPGSLTVTMGVTNDKQNTAGLGRSWAGEINALGTLFIISELAGQVSVAGSDDIEAGFGPPSAVFTWVHAYESATRAPLINTGSADGCAPYGNCDVIADGGEDSPWNQGDYWSLGVTVKGHVRMSFPQIYCRGQTQQWQQISLWGALHGSAADGGKRPDRFRSDLTQGGTPALCAGSIGPYIANGYTATSTFLAELNKDARTRQASIPYVQFVSGIAR